MCWKIAWLACLVLLARQAQAKDLETVKESLAEQQYQKALELRLKSDASAKQLAQAASLLKAAAGLKILKPEISLDGNSLLGDGEFDEIAPGIQVSKNTHNGALKLLSKLYFSGREGLFVNPIAAFALIKHAAKRGDPEAQRDLGLWLSIGINEPSHDLADEEDFSLATPDFRRGFVYLYNAAKQNDSLAQLALGYRYSLGLEVEKSCATAATYYGSVAKSVIQAIENKSLSPFSHLKVDRIPLSAQGGIFRVTRDQERLHYQWFADMGYVDAQRAVGRLLSQGDEDEARQALKYFRKAAEAGDVDAQAHLGHHYANGIGVKQDNVTAMAWFRTGANGGSSSAQFGLGYMYLHGHGVDKDYRLAYTYLKQASEKGHPEAWFHLGTMHMNGWGVAASQSSAQNYFALAAKVGHILAQYNLALTFLDHEESCEMGLHRLKDVAERGPWISFLQESLDQFSLGDYGLSLMGYLKASELGYELAQVNSAWMISKGLGLPSSITNSDDTSQGNFTSFGAALSVKQNQRASQQGNVEAMLAVADTFYYGRGVKRDWLNAFKLYSSAANYGRSGQAFFNLGYMHQMGLGVSHDSALAKRNYDKAVEVQSTALVPVKIALFSLSIQQWCQNILPNSLFPSIFASMEENVHPAGTYLPKSGVDFGFLDRILDYNFWDPEGIWREKYDYAETYLLAFFGLALTVVLLRRRQIRGLRNRIVRANFPAQNTETSNAPQTVPNEIERNLDQNQGEMGGHSVSRASESSSRSREQMSQAPENSSRKNPSKEGDTLGELLKESKADLVSQKAPDTGTQESEQEESKGEIHSKGMSQEYEANREINLKGNSSQGSKNEELVLEKINEDINALSIQRREEDRIDLPENPSENVPQSSPSSLVPSSRLSIQNPENLEGFSDPGRERNSIDLKLIEEDNFHLLQGNNQSSSIEGEVGSERSSLTPIDLSRERFFKDVNLQSAAAKMDSSINSMQAVFNKEKSEKTGEREI